MQEKEPNRFAFRGPCELKPRSCPLNVYKMIEVRGAYRHGRYVKIGLKSLQQIIDCLSFFVCKTDKQLAGRMDECNSLRRCITRVPGQNGVSRA